MTVSRFASIREGRIVFSESLIPVAERAILDKQARDLAIR